MRNLFLSCLILIAYQQVLGASGVTYHGRILRPDGTAVNGQYVGFLFRIMDGDTGSCEMYRETQTVDMRVSNGVFALVVGTPAAGGTFNVAGISYFDEIFQNARTFNFTSPAGCIGTPYAAGVRDGRNLFVQFREDPASAWENLPMMAINHVPSAYSALVANKVGEHGASSLLRVENAGTPGAATALTSANMTELMALLGGTTAQYIKSVTGTAGQIGVNTTSGAATVSLLDVATVTPGTYGSATQIPVFTVDAKGRVTGVTNTTITGGGGGGITDLTGDVTASGTGSVAATIANNAVTTAKINGAAVTDAKLASDSVNSAKIVDGSITGSDLSGTAALSIASVAATGNVGAGTMTTRSIGLYELPVNGLNSVSLQSPADLTVDTTYTLPGADGSANQVLQTDGAGLLSWASLPSVAGMIRDGGNATGAEIVIGTDDANKLSLETSNAKRLTIDALGNVGIADTSPQTALSVQGLSTTWNAIPIGPVMFRNTLNNFDNTGFDPMLTLFRSGKTGDSFANTANFSMGRYSVATGNAYTQLNLGLNDGVTNSPENTVMSWRANGRVGIGTESPARALDIRGGVYAHSQNIGLQIGVPTGQIISKFSIKSDGSGNWRTAVDATDGTTSGTTVEAITISTDGSVGIGRTSTSARLHLKAGAATAGNAPLKFSTGTLLSTAEDGAMEYESGTGLHFTIGSTRYLIPLNVTAGNFTSVSSINNSGGSITMTPAVGNSVIINQSTASTSAATGALVVNGGLGVAGAVNTAGNIISGGSISAAISGYIPQIYGSTSSAGDIKIDGTDHATKGNVLLATAGGNVGIGTTTPILKFQVDDLQTDPSASKAAVRGRSYPTLTANNSQDVSGVYGSISPVIPAGVISSGEYSSLRSTATVSVAGNAGTLSYLAALKAGYGIQTAGGGTVTNAYGLRLQPNHQAGTIVNSYGVKIEAPTTGGTVTNEYGIYQDGTTAKNYFAGNVGIGTISPGAKLDVVGPVGTSFTGTSLLGMVSRAGGTGDYAGIDFMNNGRSTVNPLARIAMITTASGSNLRFGTTNDWTSGGITNTAMTIDHIGNVGIGTAVPTAKLHTYTATGTQSYVKVDTAVNQLSGILLANVGTNKWAIANRASESDNFYISASPASTGGADIAASAKMTILQTGNVGIGTTAPTAVMMLKAGTAAAGTAPLKLTAGTNLTTPEAGAIEFDGTNLYYTTAGGVRQTLATGGAGSGDFKADGSVSMTGNVKMNGHWLSNDGNSEGVYVATDGKVGIGTSSLDQALNVTGNIGLGSWGQIGGGLGFGCPGCAKTSSITLYNSSWGSMDFSAESNGGGTGGYNFYVDGDRKLVVEQGGDVGIGTSNPVAKLDVAGNVKLGTTGSAFTAMGACTVSSVSPTNTASNYSCSGVPASAAIAVSCSADSSFSAGVSLYCRATGTAGEIRCNTSGAQANSVNLTCMWMQP